MAASGALLPAGSAPAAFAPAAASAQTGGPTRIMIVGDSASIGSTNDYTWRYRLWKHLERTAPGTVDFVGERNDLYDFQGQQYGSQDYLDPAFDRDHHAHWGRALREEKNTIDWALGLNQADVLLLMMGAIDLAYFSTPQQVVDDVHALISRARTVNPDIDVVVGHLVTVCDFWSETVYLQAESAAYNQILDASVAGWSTPTSRVTTAAVDVGWNPRAMTWDCGHPNPDGEIHIAAAFADALASWGIGAPYGPRPTGVPWPVTGTTPTAVERPHGVELSWAPVPGAVAYYLQARVLSWGQQEFEQLPWVVWENRWSTDQLEPGWVIDWRVVPVKGSMIGQPGGHVRATALGP